MKVHNWLGKKFAWYRGWHQKKYANRVHIAILIAVTVYDLYLIFNLQVIVRTI